MNRFAFVLAMALTIISCGQGNPDGYTIKGRVSNCGEWGNGGHIVLVSNHNGAIHKDTTVIRNGRFTIKGYTKSPDFASMYPLQHDKDKPAGRILFYLENADYTVTVNNGFLESESVKGGRSDMLFRELSRHTRMLDEKYSIESIERQLHTTLTPPDRIEKLLAIKRDYESALKTFRDSIITANTPSNFSLHMTLQAIRQDNLDSIRQAVKAYISDDRYRDNYTLKTITEIIEKERRP